MNFGLDQWYNSYEDGMHREAGITADRADRILDKNSHIGIIATEA